MNWGPSRWEGTNEMGDHWDGGPMRWGTNGMSDAWVLIGGPMRWGDWWVGGPMRWGTNVIRTNEMGGPLGLTDDGVTNGKGDQWDGGPMIWGTNEMRDQWAPIIYWGTNGLEDQWEGDQWEGGTVNGSPWLSFSNYCMLVKQTLVSLPRACSRV